MSAAVAVIVAAGKGVRFGGEGPKQFHAVRGRPLLAYTMESFARCAAIARTVLVLPAERFTEAERIMRPHVERASVELVPGGDTRQASVRAGLDRLVTLGADGDTDPEGLLVVVHDGARPLVTPELIAGVVAAASRYGGAIAAIPVVETLKQVSVAEERLVVRTVDREIHWRAQTPQCFRGGLLRRAYEQAERDSFVGTDESALVERLGVSVAVVPGDEENLKVTSLDDVARLEYALARRGG